MGVYVYGDFDVNTSGYIEEVYSVDEACQRVRFILTTKRRSFIYNRDFGADFSLLFESNGSEEEKNKLAELLCREALAEQKEISVENVTAENIGGGKYRLKMNVVFGELSKVMEVDVS